MTTHLEFLGTIVTHTVQEPPPGKLLVGPEAIRWADAFAFARSKPSGERVGVRRDGVAAAIKLARSMAKDNHPYRRDARCRTLTEAILNASMEKFIGRAPDAGYDRCGRSRGAQGRRAGMVLPERRTAMLRRSVLAHARSKSRSGKLRFRLNRLAWSSGGA